MCVLYTYKCVVYNNCYIHTASTVVTDAVSGVTEEDTSQDDLTSYPNTVHSGMCGYVITVNHVKIMS